MSDSEKVTSLFGGTVGAINEPIPEVIAFVERLLARAKSGDIRTIAVAYVRGNGRPSEGWQDGDDRSHVFTLHSGIACLFGHFTEMMNAPDSSVDAQPPPEAG